MWYNKEFWFDKQNYFNFFPSRRQTIEDRANAIFMYFLYVGLVLTLLRKNWQYMFIVLIGALLSVSYHGELFGNERGRFLEEMIKNKELDRVPNQMRSESVDPVTGELCQEPTPENPFMNRLNGDAPDRVPACSYENQMVEDKQKEFMDSGVYRTTGDIWQKNPYNYWITVPDKGILGGDMKEYRDFLFGDMKTPRCKEMGTGSTVRDKIISGAQCHKQSYKFVPPQ